MSDNVFKTKQSTSDAPPVSFPHSADKSTTSVVNDVEPPYLDYQSVNKKPFSVDYFELGDLWDDPDGGFADEVSTVENYFKQLIESGEIENSPSAVKNKLKQIEKTVNTSKDERKVVRLGTIASYLRFLTETSGIRRNVKKYGISN